MTEASELVGGDSGKPQRHSHRLLDLCVVAGLQPARLDMLLKDLQQNGDDAATVSPEVLSVHAPPFIGPQSARTGPEESGAPPGNCHGSAHPPSEAMATRKGVDLCGIPELCFPDGFHLDTEGKPDSFHFLVLTDIHGNREQGVVLRVYRELQDPQDTEPVDVSPRPRAPVAICLISKFPYYSALKDCLSCVLPELRACGQQEFDRKVRELAAQLTLVPCPPPGSLQLCFELGPIIVVLPPPGDVDTPPIDISLHLPLLCFSPSTVLQIVTCLLTERRLVFVSRDWPLLTLMTECFVYYLRPLPWRHPYIPVLASSMLDMLMAPTVFLMGCHSRHIRTVIELEELVLVDIDTGTVVFPQTPEHQAPPLPTAITEEFITSVQRLRLHPELASASLPICTGLAAARQRDLHRRQQINSHVQRIFLQLIGSLLRDVSKYLNLKHRVFIKKDFLDSREPASQPFYISHLRTDLFHCFLKARLNDRVDAFSRWEMATRPQTPRLNAEPSPTGHSSPFTSDAARTSNDHMSQEPSLAASLASHHPGDPGNTGVRVRPTIVPRCLYLPPLPSAPLDDLSVSLFYTKLVVDITRELEGVGGDDGGVRAVCLYLRGVVRLCQGQPVPALLDFQSLEKIDMDFFPLELVRQTLESMSTEQLRALQETEGLKGLLHGVLEKHWDRARPEHSVRDLELPVWPLDRQQFTALAQAAGLVSTAITADCLFDILAAGQDHVSPRMFTRMYGQWRGCGEEGAVGCPSEVLACLREGEILSLVSLPVKTNQGTGRLLLTNHRLCLLTDSTAPCREIAQLRDVEEVEAAVPVSGLPLRGGSLKVGVRGQKHAFVATLRGERDLWKLALRELCAGKLLAHRHKDPHYNQQARSNVRLLQAVALCPPPARTAHLMCRLAQLDQAASQPLPEVPQMTSDALRHTLHLSDAASISLTVTALLYVPGSLDPGERADSPPTLWCTLADGRLLVYNAATWEMERPPLRAGTARLNCVLLVYGGGLWLGSEDSYIYVVSGEDQSCHRRLTAHRNQVTGLVQGTLGQASPVFSCSMDGTVVVWDPVTMESCSQLQLQQCCHLSAISLHQRNLWCCADHSLVLLAWDGQQLQKVIHGLSPDGGSVPWSHFLILPQREEVWVLSTPSCSLYVWSMRCLSAPAWVVSMPSAGHCMVHVKEQVWVGGAAPDGGGRIQVVSAADRSLVKELEASGGPVTALCCAHDRYMLSASATGQASIWSVD